MSSGLNNISGTTCLWSSGCATNFTRRSLSEKLLAAVLRGTALNNNFHISGVLMLCGLDIMTSDGGRLPPVANAGELPNVSAT